jgi:hypothetical protein
MHCFAEYQVEVVVALALPAAKKITKNKNWRVVFMSLPDDPVAEKKFPINLW